MKKRLYILFPGDRFNYGDLLFPYIIRFYFSKFFNDIKYVSSTKSDLSSKGGIPTEDYSSLYNLDSNYENHLIVAGGESLCVRWGIVLSYVKPSINVMRRLSYILSRIIGKPIFDMYNWFIDKLYHPKTHYVFSVGKNELPNFKTISYNALGGTHLLNSNVLKSKKTRQILNSVDYLTVREKTTSQALKANDIRHQICPDTAIMMSEVFSEEMLSSRLSINHFNMKDKYIFFQGRWNVWEKCSNLAVRQLEQLCKETSLKICMCPIGTTVGHSDDKALQLIYEKFSLKESCVLITNPNIFDIMWLIKHSELYIGSSLHGTITAMSFDVPSIGYGPLKLKAYIEQWATFNYSKFVEKELIAKEAILLNKNIKNISQGQRELVKVHFSEMAKLYI